MSSNPASLMNNELGVVLVLIKTKPKYCGMLASRVLIDCGVIVLPSLVAPFFPKKEPSLSCLLPFQVLLL